jgi:hypothetical protein
MQITLPRPSTDVPTIVALGQLSGRVPDRRRLIGSLGRRMSQPPSVSMCVRCLSQLGEDTRHADPGTVSLPAIATALPRPLLRLLRRGRVQPFGSTGALAPLGLPSPDVAACLHTCEPKSEQTKPQVSSQCEWKTHEIPCAALSEVAARSGWREVWSDPGAAARGISQRPLACFRSFVFPPSQRV